MRLREEQRRLLKGEDGGDLGPMFGDDDDDSSSEEDASTEKEIHRISTNRNDIHRRNQLFKTIFSNGI